jgi:flagellar L-ring protein precursor FlgH
MIRNTTRIASTLVALGVIIAAVPGCNLLTRMSEVGDGPKLTKITNPTARPDYRPVSLPMPAPRFAEDNPNSLWRAGARAFFKDTRAKAIGDILTVKLNLKDKATMDNKTERERDDNEKQSVSKLLGLEAEFAKVLPQAVDPTAMFEFDTEHQTKGDASINRSEDVELTFAAVITQILPNGALVVLGRQEVRVNFELRELMLTGVVRPEDIESDNSIDHTRIAEMRVAYGGRGTLSEVQQPRWGTQIWDIIYPF